jgi:hypothetical protein
VIVSVFIQIEYIVAEISFPATGGDNMVNEFIFGCIKSIYTPSSCSYPEVARAVLHKRGNIIVSKTSGNDFGMNIVYKMAVFEFAKTSFCTNPEISFFIIQKALNNIIYNAITVVVSMQVIKKGILLPVIHT